MNQTEFARHMGVSKGYITQLKDAGRLVFSADGKVDVEASELRIRETADPNRDDVKTRHALAKQQPEPKKESKSDGHALKFSEGRAKEQHFKALQAEIEYEERIGNLVRKDDVEMAVADMVTTFRQALENLPHRVSTSLVNKDIDFIRATLKQEMHDALATLQRACDDKLKQQGAE